MDRIQKLKEFLQLNPNDSFLKHALGLEYRKIGRDEEALRCFESVIENDPSYVGTYYQLGKYWEGKGNPNKAMEYYGQGLKAAQAVGDRHAQNELRTAMEELEE